MDHHSFSSYHSHLAQMPTDQRELEYHHLPVQTTGAEGILPVNALQSYAPVTNWATSRLYLTTQSIHPQHPGYSTAWLVPFSGPSEQPSLSHPSAFAPQNPEYSAFYSLSSNLSAVVPSSSTMDRLSPQEMRSEQGDFISGRDERSLSTPWVSQPHFTRRLSIVRPMNVQQQEESDGASPSNLTASLSPTSTTSHHYLSQSSDGAHSTPMSITADGSSPQTTGSFGEITDGDHHTDPPYSQLIYQALSEAQDCKLQLQDIYAWFEKNTSKGKDPTTKGWQNSIRHNLSMNQGFYAIKNETRGGKRTMNYWSLTPEAIRNGKVESTTRFRKSTPRKIHSADAPARRQGGNQKGKVTEKWNELRQANQNRERQARNAAGSALQAPTPIDDRYPPQSEMSAYQVSPQPETQIPPYQVPPVAPASQFPVRSTLLFGMETVNGCSPPPHGSSPVFCERNQPSSAYMAALQLRRAQMGQRPYVQSGFNPGPNNGSVAGAETHPNIQNGV